jgi:Tol biopolymer transport system component
MKKLIGVGLGWSRSFAPWLVALLLSTTIHGQDRSDLKLSFSSDRTGRFQVFAVTQQAGMQVTTTSEGNQESRSPDWSSATDRITYQFGASGVRGIHMISPDGSGDVRLTMSQSDERDPSWSPDGQFIVYAFLAAGSDYDLWIHKVGNPDDPGDDEDYSLLSRPGSLDLSPAWSPEGTRIAFVTSGPTVGGDAEIAVFDVAPDEMGRIQPAGPVRMLTDNTFTDFDPTWSPDGRSLAFSTTRSGGRDIYRMNAELGEQDTANFVQLTTHAANDRNPSWSPYCETIAFVSERDGNSEIYGVRYIKAAQISIDFARSTGIWTLAF